MKIIVTGASRGIGNAIYNHLINDGHDVIGTSRCKVEYPELDLLDVYGIEDFWKDNDNIDVLINNAGICQRKDFLELSEYDINMMFDTNLKGTFLMCQEAVRRGVENIINIASIGGIWGGTEQIHYAVTKAGIINLTKSIAKTYPNIRCNCISPGIIDTDMIDVSKVDLSRIPMGRIGNPDEICSTIDYLINPKTSYLTGQNININGGML
jgi:NAD(P)-dependent dehydrogenase (short-subunit alcohol dehydrogenase family)